MRSKSESAARAASLHSARTLLCEFSLRTESDERIPSRARSWAREQWTGQRRPAYERWERGEGVRAITLRMPPGRQLSQCTRREPARCPWAAGSVCSCSRLQMPGYDQPRASRVHGVASAAHTLQAGRPSAQQSANSPHLGSKQPPTTSDVESRSRCKSRKFKIHRTTRWPF